MLKQITDKHEASRGLSVTAELLVAFIPAATRLVIIVHTTDSLVLQINKVIDGRSTVLDSTQPT